MEAPRLWDIAMMVQSCLLTQSWCADRCLKALTWADAAATSVMVRVRLQPTQYITVTNLGTFVKQLNFWLTGLSCWVFAASVTTPTWPLLAELEQVCQHSCLPQHFLPFWLWHLQQQPGVLGHNSA